MQEQEFTAESVLQGRGLLPRMDGTGQGNRQGLGLEVGRQASKQGLGLPSADNIARGLLQGVVSEGDLASMPQELAMNAMVLADQFKASQQA